MGFSDFEILSCIPGYPNNVKVGDCIKPQHVAAGLDILIPYAKEILEDLTTRGFLVYDEGKSAGNGSLGRIPGWHITKLGLTILYK